MSIKELASVVLTDDLPQLGLCRGGIETILLAHGDRGYEVEFVSLNGETLAVTLLSPKHVRPVSGREIAHARPIEAA